MPPIAGHARFVANLGVMIARTIMLIANALGRTVRMRMRMICKYCGGQVLWQGDLININYTLCMDCGERNCQVIEDEALVKEQADKLRAGDG